VRDIISAFAGDIPEPNDDPDVTAVPANSTPMAPSPVAELYLYRQNIKDESRFDVWWNN